MGDDVAFAGIAGQRELLRGGELTSRELVELALARIERLDAELNAFTVVYAERALHEAGQADGRRAAQEDAPLLGLPVAVKDEIDLAGEVTRKGTDAFIQPAATDAEVVRRLRTAGAIVVGKTTMPELGLWPFTESVTCGVTRNPWDVERTPGGSSGGSAAAVAAGMVPCALAADGAGSIRIPAACTGLVGLKPQAGRVPRAPHDRDGSHWIVFGGLTRSVADSAILLDVLADRTDGGAPFADVARAEPGALRIALDPAFPAGVRGTLAPEVRTALEGTAELLGQLGHTVEERDLAFRVGDAAVILGLLFRGIRDIVDEAERPVRLERRSRAIARPGRLVSDRMRDRLLAAERRIAERVGRLFTECDALLMPVMSAPAPPAGIMEGRGATATYLWESSWVPFNVLWNSTGQPAASVPAGFSPEGLPLAVQLVGRPYDEATLLSLAAQLEAARPWGDLRPPIG